MSNKRMGGAISQSSKMGGVTHQSSLIENEQRE